MTATHLERGPRPPELSRVHTVPLHLTLSQTNVMATANAHIHVYRDDLTAICFRVYEQHFPRLGSTRLRSARLLLGVADAGHGDIPSAPRVHKLCFCPCQHPPVPFACLFNSYSPVVRSSVGQPTRCFAVLSLCAPTPPTTSRTSRALVVPCDVGRVTPTEQKGLCFREVVYTGRLGGG